MRGAALIIALALAAAACGGTSSPTGSATAEPEVVEESKYCTILLEEIESLEAKYEARFAATGRDPIADLFVAAATSAEVLGDMALLVNKLEREAPDELVPAHEIVANQLEADIEQLREVGSNPIAAIFGSLATSAATSSAYREVDGYSQETCGIQIFGTAPTTTERVTDSEGETVVRDIVPSRQDVDALLQNSGITAAWWRQQTSGLTCAAVAGGVGQEAQRTDGLDDQVGRLEFAEIAVVWADTAAAPGDLHQMVADGCDVEFVKDLGAAAPDGVELYAHQYDDRYRAYVSNGELLVVFDHSASDTVLEGRFVEVVEAIATNMSGELASTPVQADPDALYVSADGTIELEPTETRYCGVSSKQYQWAGPNAAVAFCNTSDLVGVLHFDLEGLRHRWTYPLPAEARYNTDAFEVAQNHGDVHAYGSDELVAIIVSLRTEASGLDAERFFAQLHVIDAESGQAVDIQEFDYVDRNEVDHANNKVRSIGVIAVGEQIVWLQVDNDVHIVNVRSGEATVLPETQAKTEFWQGAEWRGNLLLRDRGSDAHTWYRIADASTFHAAPSFASVVDGPCATHASAWDAAGNWINISTTGETRVVPEAALAGIPTTNGWLEIDRGVRFYDLNGNVTWEIDNDVVRDARYSLGRLWIENKSSEVFVIDLADGTIAEEIDLDYIPGDTLDVRDHWASDKTLSDRGRVSPSSLSSGCANP